MTEDEKNSVALFRYGIISELITGVNKYPTKDAYFKAKSEQEWINKNGDKVSVHEKTIERWYYNYLKYGFDVLKPKNRNDTGRSRRIDDELLNIINHYVIEHSEMKRYEASHINEIWCCDTTYSFKINVGEEKRITPVIILDEANYLPSSVLNDLKIILNFDMDSKEPYILLLIGQNTIRASLNMKAHEALKQRISMNYNFQPMDKDESKNILMKN